MADNTATTAADVPDQAQQNSPFMKLPTELRLRIYKFAFEDIVDKIAADTAKQQHVQIPQGPGEFWTSPSRKEHPTFIGVIGFLHTNRKLRRESLDALVAHVEAYKNVCRSDYDIAVKVYRTCPNLDSRRERDDWSRGNRLRQLAFHEAAYRHQRMYIIHHAIEYVRLLVELYDKQQSCRLEKSRQKEALVVFINRIKLQRGRPGF
jgi:hypothetical protein